MGKHSIDKQVYEQYVDAAVALFMEHYAAALSEELEQTDSPVKACPEALDQRCMALIRKTCAKQRRQAFWAGTKKVLHSAAMLVMALLSLSSILFMTVEAFRVPVINYFIEQDDGFWAITGRKADDPVTPTTADAFDPDDPLAGLLPEGYALVDVKKGENGKSIATYKNGQGNRVFLWIRPNTSDVTVNSENASASRKCMIAGYDGVYVERDNMTQLVWVDKAENATYMLNADAMDEKQLIALAEKIFEKK